ncbi:MAG: sensor domain-containing diguanylate cyclase [Deltaproteobacteria bacterium]
MKDTRTDELKRKIEELSIFNEIGKTLTSTLDIKEILNIIMLKIGELLRPDNWSLLLVDEERGDLYFEIVVGERAEKIKHMRLKMGEGIAGWVAVKGEKLLIPDVSKDERFTLNVDLVSGFETRSVVCVPLKCKGKVLGVIELVNKAGRNKFSEEDLFILTTLADYAAIALENAQYFHKVKELTITDDVTRLYNSRYMYDYLDQEMRRSQRYEMELSIIFLDLDYFKNVNDTYGHLVGSRLLREIAKVIITCLRDVDIAVRYGGDEFVVILPSTPKKNAVLVAERIRDCMKNTVFLQSQGLKIRQTASFGVASFPKDANNKLDLIRQADKAMYRIKNSSRDGIEAS